MTWPLAAENSQPRPSAFSPGRAGYLNAYDDSAETSTLDLQGTRPSEPLAAAGITARRHDRVLADGVPHRGDTGRRHGGPLDRLRILVFDIQEVPADLAARALSPGRRAHDGEQRVRVGEEAQVAVQGVAIGPLLRHHDD